MNGTDAIARADVVSTLCEGHKFFARNDAVLRLAVEARGGEAVGRLGDFEGGACME